MINIRLPYPPTVNTYYTIARGRKILSKRGREWKKDALLELLQQKPPKIEGRLEVRVDAHVPDRRKRDLDNILKPVLDLLCEGRVILDDCFVDDLRVRRRPVSKPGYVRVCICEVD